MKQENEESKINIPEFKHFRKCLLKIIQKKSFKHREKYIVVNCGDSWVLGGYSECFAIINRDLKAKRTPHCTPNRDV